MGTDIQIRRGAGGGEAVSVERPEGEGPDLIVRRVDILAKKRGKVVNHFATVGVRVG
jgi:hypothetical protein